MLRAIIMIAIGNTTDSLSHQPDRKMKIIRWFLFCLFKVQQNSSFQVKNRYNNASVAFPAVLTCSAIENNTSHKRGSCIVFYVFVDYRHMSSIDWHCKSWTDFLRVLEYSWKRGLDDYGSSKHYSILFFCIYLVHWANLRAETVDIACSEPIMQGGLIRT